MIIVMILLSFIAGLLLGSYILFRLILKAYTADPNSFIRAIEQTIVNRTTEFEYNEEFVEFIEVEKYESKFLISLKRNGVFISQGSSLTEAIDNARDRYPNVHFQLVGEDKEISHI